MSRTPAPGASRDATVVEVAREGPAGEYDATQDDARPVEARAPAPLLLSGRYELGGLLGEGGMGEVHECRDRVVERAVALKTIRRDRQARHLEARFIREASVQAQLEHPSVVPVFEIGHDEAGSAFFTMRKVSGVSLEEVLERKRRDADASESDAFGRHRLLTAFAQVCLTVHYAHARGVLHRDLKPSNIMFGDFGEIYVLDWGLAKLAPDAPVGPEESALATGRHQTVAGTTMGTPAYMAPEQVAARELDARADVFALGAVLFEILTLEPLLVEAAVEMRLRGEEPTWDARPSARAPERQVPPEFDRICVRATAVDVEKRYASARALHDVIEAYLEGERDLELRTRVATSLLERAEKERIGDRDAALRDVNRALALAPGDPRGLELLVDLLKQTPKSSALARAEVQSEGVERLRRVQPLGAALFLFPWLTFFPVIAMRRGVTSVWGALAPPLAWLCFAIAVFVDQRQRTQDRVRYPTVLAMFAVGMTSLLFGPLLIVPALAATTVATHLLVSTRRNRPITVLLACAAILVPMLFVWTGINDAYRFIDETTFSVKGVLRTIAPFNFGLLLTGIDLLMLFSTALFASKFRDEIERARTAKVLFAWQLSKLLPVSVGNDALPDAAASTPRPKKGSDSVSRLLDTEIDSAPLQAVAPTTFTRADGERPDADPSMPLLAHDGARYVQDVVIAERPSTLLHRCRDRLVGRDVAMKRLRPELAAMSSGGAKHAFTREALVQARIDHPAVPPVYDIGVDAEGPWFTVKLVRGRPLSEILRAEVAAEHAHQRLAAFAKVCLAIAFAHEHGIVHAALEPGNIVLGEFGEVYVLGWSHATTVEQAPASARGKLVPEPTTREYMAPERLDGHGATPESDIYALGAILFDLAADTPSSGARLPHVLDEICARAMSRDPANRQRSARELHDAIEAFLSSDRDGELRQKLAAERLARAEKSIERAATDETARVDALRDIGRALALATDRTPALGVLSRLLAIPPTTLPQEVSEELSAQVWAFSRQASPAAALTYIASFVIAFPLYALVVGVRDLTSTLAIAGAWAVAAVVVHGQHTWLRSASRTPWAGIAALFAVGMTSLLFGTYFMVPGLAITITMVYVLSARPQSRLLVVACGCGALVVPAVLMWTGVSDVCALSGGTSPEAFFTIRGATYHPPAVFLGGLVITNLLNVLFVGFYAARYRDMLDRLEEENRAKVHALSRLM